MKVRIVATALLATVAGGCQQHNLTRSADALYAAPACCSGVADLPFQAVELGKEQPIPLEDTSPAFVFPEGKRFFRALALPSWNGPLQITVYSDLARSFGGASGVVRPTVRLYDAQFQPTRVVTAEPDRHWQGMRFEMTFFINEADRAERYLVVYPHDGAGDGGQSALEYSPVQVGHGVLLVPVTVGAVSHSRHHAYSPTGPLRLKVEAYRPALVGERDS